MFGLSPLEGAAALLLAGSLLFTLASVVGLLRLPDFYTRLHAVGKCDTAGLALAVAALALLGGDLILGLKLALIWVVLAGANPTATHALARAARRSGVAVWTSRAGTTRASREGNEG